MLSNEAQSKFVQARRAVIEAEYKNLNPEQRKAVMTTEGPLLLLAGAGSGKTTVLISRIANLMKFGDGAFSDEVPDWVVEDDVDFLAAYAVHPLPEAKEYAEQLCRMNPATPWSIIAITFTNKAAGELKERLERMLGDGANDVWASTFHSSCLRILRRDIEKLGYSKDFTIYDTADSERVVKDIMKENNMDDKALPARSIRGVISKAKDSMQDAATFLRNAEKAGDFRQGLIAKVYLEYEKRLRDASALDFDDLILQTVRLLQDHEDVRSYYQNKFRYVLIDEYQDTNQVQYQLAALLAGKYENICVVGDDDQSIYRFRGATIENIMSFEKQYKGAKVIRLEQNYRSTKHILEASNAVIKNNQGRKGKELWTQHDMGDKIQLHTAMDETAEAQFVAGKVLENYGEGIRWSDHAVLYRMNAQSNQIEQMFKRNSVPYRIIGGTRFFDRAEVKDMLAYLCVINNPTDDLRLSRIINVPARGIGAKTIETAQVLAQQNNTTMWDVITHAYSYPDLSKAVGKLNLFVSMMEEMRQLATTDTLEVFYETLVDKTGYAVALEAKNTVEDRTRLENVRELLTSIKGYVENEPETPSLSGFLDEIALYTDLDNHNAEEDCVVMMTMHSAKGLEFPVVFVVGVEEGIFPGMRSIGDREEMEEERRLCYVAMTRAKKTLYMTSAGRRMLFGRTSTNPVSRFTKEIPEEFVDRSGKVVSDLEESFGKWNNASTTRGAGPVTTIKGSGLSGSGSSTPHASTGFGGGGFASKAATTALPSFQKGEMISHKAFGKGMITAITPMGGDALVEIAFDEKGTKRLMLKSASAHMSKA